jgi:hypothetical protein
MRVPPQVPPLPLPGVKPGEKAKLIASLALHPPPALQAAPEALLIRLSQEPLALFGILHRPRHPEMMPMASAEAQGGRMAVELLHAASRAYGEQAEDADRPRVAILQPLMATAPSLAANLPPPAEAAVRFTPSEDDRRAALPGREAAWPAFSAFRDFAQSIGQQVQMAIPVLVLVGMLTTALAFWLLL